MDHLTNEVKAKETHEKAVGYFKVSEQYGYKFIMEVKKIRDDRYYKELGFSTFEEYCQQAWGYSRQWMNTQIQSASKLNESDFENYSYQFGVKKTFFIATMDGQQREQAINEGIPTEQGNKSLNEATQKEISEWRKKYNQSEQARQQAESQAESERKERERLENELENQEPEVKEVFKEIDNTDYETIKKLEDEIEQLKRKSELESQDAETYRQLKKDIDNLRNRKNDIVKQIDNASSIGKFIARIDRSFEEDLAPIKYSRAIEELERSESVQESLNEIVSKVENWCREIRGIMKNNNITEVIDYEEQ